MENVNRYITKISRTFIAIVGLSAALAVNAATYSFVPSDGAGDPDDIWDLDHYKYFTWGIKNFSLPVGQVVTSATLTFNNINNWTASENNGTNWLNVWLMDRALVEGNFTTGTAADGKLKMYADNQAPSDIFDTWQPTINKTKIGVYTDYSGGPNGDVINLTFNFSLYQISKFNQYIQNGNNFALGFDPDCHYWNTGVNFQVITAEAGNSTNVPDQTATLALISIGLASILGFRRKSLR